MRVEFARMLSAAVRVREVQLAGWAFRNNRRQVRTRPLFGYQMHIDVSRSGTHQLLYLTGERMIPERALLAGLIEPRMTVVDVGANIGYYLLLIERMLGHTGRVVCIEPSMENLVELRRNIATNELTNVVVHDVAVGEASRQARLRAGLNGFINECDGDPVRIEPLDVLVDGRIDVIKIDVEGYEGHVLKGCLETLRRDRPAIFLELHPGLIKRFGFSPDEIVETLRPLYSSIEAWELDDPIQSSRTARLWARYLGTGRTLLRREIEDLLAECHTWPWDRTCWLICRSQATVDPDQVRRG